MSKQYSVISSAMVSVIITTSEDPPQCILDKRFDKKITISDMKGKLELLTGGQASSMKIKVYNKDNELVCSLDDDNSMLGSYHIEDGMRLNVEDQFILKKEMLNNIKVEKLELSTEEYAKRTDTLRAYLEKNKIGKYNKEEMKKKEEDQRKEEEQEEYLAKSIKVDDRCKIKVLGQPERLGSVKFVGTVEFKPGWWIGVKYDEPLGKNDGSVSGIRYFECQPKYGGFVRPSCIQTGDFPEEDLDLNEEL
uniref:CAP-Gly domain-containing protein n=1 Tax=Clastoptera arizonana TaxID=38151 RepID=A0A1B6DM77_9HEMI